MTADEEKIIKMLSVGISVTIFLLNQVANEFVPILVDMELHVSNSNKIVSHAKKLSLISLINSALIDFLITVIYSKNYYFRGGFIYT